MTKGTVYIVDDNDSFRKSATWMLEGEDYTVHAFSDPYEAIDGFSSFAGDSPSCVLMDVRMPGMSGLDLHQKMINENIDVPVVYMTGHGDVPLAVEAMQKGALTFLEKPLQIVELRAALARAFSEPVQRSRGTRPNSADISRFRERWQTLTPREKQIIDKVVDGNTNMVIGFDLEISIKTVELHRSRAVKKLGVRSVPELVKMVIACQ